MRISDWSSDVCSSDLDANADQPDIRQKLDQYVRVRLTTDLSALSENQKQMIPLLIDAARIMDSLFWYEAYGRRDSLLDALDDERSGEAGAIQEYVRINYGPWDRLDNNRPFIEGVGEKTLGANFFPSAITKEEFEQADPRLE